MRTYEQSDIEPIVSAYHFLTSFMYAGSGDEPPWTIGEQRVYDGAVFLCKSGYHSAPSWYDALKYAPGPIACKVLVSRPVECDRDKQVSRCRKLVAAKDATKTLHLYACDCAERALSLLESPDPRSVRGIAVKRAWLAGDATDKELAASRAAASDAAWDATWGAAKAAAKAAVSATERAAASAAVNATERAASSADASTTTMDAAEIAWQRNALAERLDALFA